MAERRERFFEGLQSALSERLTVQITTSDDSPPSDFSNYSFINWGGHCTSDPKRWGGSSIAFGTRVMPAMEIASSWRFRSNPDVVLAGCSTAVDGSSTGTVDEYCGLDMAFRIAGARSVLSTLWAVPDDLAALANIVVSFSGADGRRRSLGESSTAFQHMLRTGRWREFFLTDDQLAQLPAAAETALREVQGAFSSIPDDVFSSDLSWRAFRCLEGA